MTLHSSCPLHLAHSLLPAWPNLRIRSAAARTFQVYQHQNRPQVDIFYIIHTERIFPLCRHVADMWIQYLQFWHNHKIIGLENIPLKGPGI